MKDLIFRASSVPNLMGAKGLGVTGQKEAVKAYLTQFYDRHQDIKSKYLDKGIAMESGAIELINELCANKSHIEGINSQDFINAKNYKATFEPAEIDGSKIPWWSQERKNIRSLFCWKTL